MSCVSAATANLDPNDEDKCKCGSEKSNKLSTKMFSIGRELCFLLLIVFTAYASFSSSNNTGSGPPPTPFFPRGSIVGDFYKGELSEALHRASEGDVSFVMYYAPWDAESQVARKQFITVAHQHYKQVYFAGINCWQPRSECRRTLSKLQQFPKLVAYVTHETGVEFRGPHEATYMSAFLEGVMRPLHRITSPADLAKLRSSYNAVVVAFLNFKGVLGGPPYRAMYESALKFLERDVRQEVAFAVVTSFKTTLELGGNRTPSIQLYLWNETLDYPGHFAWDNLTDWINSRLHQVSLWVSPPGVKSLTLAPYLSQGPALLMFTPFHNFVMYDLLREIGLEYYNCNNSTDVIELAVNLSNHVAERLTSVQRAALSCQSRIAGITPTVQVVNNVWANSSCGKRRMFAARADSAASQCYSHTAQCAVTPPSRSATMTSMLSTEEDPLAAPALTRWARQENCQRLMPPLPRLPTSALAAGLRGLACRHNRSLSLLALDSALFGHFALGLGVDPEKVRGHTRVLLINSQMETTHVLSEPISRSSLSQFLVNFTEGKLERFQRSQPTSLSTPSPSPSQNSISVVELTTETFMPVAFNDSVNVVVLYYTRHCAFCHAASHAVLSVAQMLRGVPSLLFTRVDGEINDLPWQFTAPHYPSVLFFPSRRKAESRVFGSRVAITVDSLSQFVLANLPLELRLLAMLQLCQRFPSSQGSARRRECLVDVRREVFEAISAHLTHYRRLSTGLKASKHKRIELGKVLTRLQHLRQLQFAVSVDSARASQLTKQFLSQLSERPLESEESTATSELSGTSESSTTSESSVRGNKADGSLATDETRAKDEL